MKVILTQNGHTYQGSTIDTQAMSRAQKNGDALICGAVGQGKSLFIRREKK